jgi:uncharacterized protein YwgA
MIEEETEIIERYIILLLGVVDNPVPSKIHLQKELFILSRTNPIFNKIINFQKHYYGPYSPDLKEILEDPVYHIDSIRIKNGKISLTEHGKRYYEKIFQENKESERFLKMMGAMKMIRELYDKLRVDELLLLIYITYQQYKKKSKVSSEILSSPIKERLAKKLFFKGFITEKRYNELIDYEEN